MGERDALFLRWELGQADAADEAALAELLRDPAARRAFARNARVAAALGAPAVAATAPAPVPSPANRPRRAKSLRLRRARPATGPRWAIAASVLLSVALGAYLMQSLPRHEAPAAGHHQPLAAQPPLPTPTPTPSAVAFAHLASAGSARIRALDGRERAGRDGEALAPGETVVAGAQATVLVLHGDAARLELAAGSSLGLPAGAADPATAPVRLELVNGTVHAEVAPRPAGAPFLIAAPLASAEVVGTGFPFATAVDGARLAVDHGAVRLAAPGDAGVLVAAGRTGMVGEGMASLVPAAADADQPLPAGSRALWRWDPVDASGWRGTIVDAADGGPAWRSVAALPGDAWASAELRSPQDRGGWAVEAGTWLRFRYHVERFAPGLELVVHLKPGDESNYS